ncbi:MAG: Hdr-like menaquinol oxidoreductase cytochrome c subunit [Gammaproteobacteria bacterium]|nr:Hdr-like menaquinol oxidoreductase cytochrome c subunit [Gammaproteobacteria bacterium]
MKQNAVKKQLRLYPYLISALLLAAFSVSLVQADVPKPDVPKAIKGEQCVEETGFMRRNHMELLKHQRDDTLREGIRTVKHSLQGCLSCHAVKDSDGTFVSVKSEKHFCNSCHSYAAVKIDCFGCHNSKPQQQVSQRNP